MTAGLNNRMADDTPNPSHSLFNLVDAAHMVAKEYPPMEWLIEDLLPKRSLCMIAGSSGVGKTILGLNLAVCVACGEDYLSFPVTKRGSVLYIDNELGEEAIGRRLTAMKRSINPGLIQVLPSAPIVKDIWREINVYCFEQKPSLIVVDSLYLAQTGREKEESDMRSFLSQVKELSQQHDTCVVLVHHFRKGTKNERADLDLISGSGAIGRILDTAVSIRRSGTDHSKRILKILKGRHCKDSLVGKTFQLSLGNGDFWFLNGGEVCEDDHIGELPEQLNARQRIRATLLNLGNPVFSRDDALVACGSLGRSRATVDRALHEMVRSGELEKVGHSCYMNSLHKVNVAPDNVRK